MSFEVGNSGKPKGAVAKQNSKFSDTMNKIGLDIALEMNERYLQALQEEDNYLAAKILFEMAQYVYPKLKSTEHKRSSALEDMTPKQRIEALRQALALLEAKEIDNE